MVGSDMDPPRAAYNTGSHSPRLNTQQVRSSLGTQLPPVAVVQAKTDGDSKLTTSLQVLSNTIQCITNFFFLQKGCRMTFDHPYARAPLTR